MRHQLTAVIPVHSMAGRLENLAKTLFLCVDLPIQVVIVHDDSGDGTEEELVDLFNNLNSSNVEKYNVRFSSPGLTRNFGIERAQAEWICFWDSDDLPNVFSFLNLQSKTLENDALVGIGQIASTSSDKLDPEVHFINPNSENFLYQIANMPGFTRMVFNRSVMDQNRFNNLRSGEDQCFLRDLNFLNYPYYVSEKVVYVYYTSVDGQLSQNAIAKRDTLKALEYLVEAYPISNGPMRIFSFAQIVKLFLSVIKNFIKERDRLFFSSGVLKAAKVISARPLAAVRLSLYFRSHKVGLAGRRP